MTLSNICQADTGRSLRAVPNIFISFFKSITISLIIYITCLIFNSLLFNNMNLFTVTDSMWTRNLNTIFYSILKKQIKENTMQSKNYGDGLWQIALTAIDIMLFCKNATSRSVSLLNILGRRKHAHGEAYLYSLAKTRIRKLKIKA